MSHKLTPDEVLKLARLSKIRLTQDEIEQFSSELSAILEYVEQLSGVDTTGLEPTSQVTGLTDVMREDEIVDYGSTAQYLLKNAPDKKDNQIKVRRVLG